MNGTKYAYDPARAAANRILFHRAGTSQERMTEIIREEIETANKLRATPSPAPTTTDAGLTQQVRELADDWSEAICSDGNLQAAYHLHADLLYKLLAENGGGEEAG